MAISSTIYKANVNFSNLNTHEYKDFNLTMAKHPSESESRMMFRLLAFLYCASEELEFTRGLSSTDEPELWKKDYSGDILHWVELGLPDEKKIRQATGKSQKVTIFTYHPNKSEEWYEKIKAKVGQNEKLSIIHFNVIENGPLEKLAAKTMSLSCLIEEGMMYLGNDDERVGIEMIVKKQAT